MNILSKILPPNVARTWGYGLAAAGLAATLSGCVMEGADGSEDLGSSRSAVSRIGGGAVLGGNSLDLGPNVHMACFLTGMRGHFEGYGEFIQVAPVNGRWVLSAGSQTGGDISGAAMCIAQDVTVTKSWEIGFLGASVPVFLQNDGSCFLQRVSGKFEGGGESVRVYQDANKNWFLSGSSGNASMRATAACTGHTFFQSFGNWAASSWDLDLKLDHSPTERACFLQGVKGAFQNFNELAWISPPVGASAKVRTPWTLHAESTWTAANKLIGATAGCTGGFNDNPVGL
ncbi:MAG TPA: hypothetical protein VHB79_08815 [Polyangiaceae bacterium]|nr:hypothetical protein [Polyangiaceae bacterium]